MENEKPLAFEVDKLFNNNILQQYDKDGQIGFLKYLLTKDNWKIENNKIVFNEINTEEKVNKEIEKFDIYIRKRNYQIQKSILEKAMVLGVFKTKELLDEERKVIVKKEKKLEHKNKKEKEL